MNKIIDQLNGFWFRQAPPHALAILRIAFGLYLLIEAATYLPAVSALFSDQGPTISFWASSVLPLIRPLFAPPSSAVAFAIFFLYVSACIGFTAGYRMRVCIAVLLLLNLYYWQLSFFLYPSSYHRIYFFFLWGFLFSGADKAFSLRMYRTHGSLYAWETASVFVQRLFAVQMTFTYLGVGLQKIALPAWQDGTILPMSLIGRWATPLGRWIVRFNLPSVIYDYAVHAVIFLEVTLPFFLWIKKTQWIGVAAGFFFHTSIALFLGIWWFLPLVPAYIVFAKPEDVYAFCKRHLPKIP